MTSPGIYERERRRLAQRYGLWALEAIAIARRPAGTAAFVDTAYRHARAAAHEARLSLQARDTREAGRVAR